MSCPLSTASRAAVVVVFVSAEYAVRDWTRLAAPGSAGPGGAGTAGIRAASSVRRHAAARAAIDMAAVDLTGLTPLWS